MNIESIRAAQLVGNTTGISREGALSGTATSFQNMLWESLSDISEAEGAVENDVMRLAVGAADGLHNITINAAKADIAISTMVSVRNKALEAYNEIMRITL